MPQNKHIVILGASGLIGSKLVDSCLDEGARISAAGRTRSDGKDELHTRSGVSVPFVAVETSDPGSVSELFSACEAYNGPVDAIINCAFPRNDNYGADFGEVTYNDFCENVNIHLGGAFLICQKAFHYFSGRGGGNIINFGSIYGIMTPRFEIYDGTGLTKEIEYVVCKAGIIQMTQYLAKYAKGRNIRVNCVSPGGVFNDQHEKFVKNYNAHGINKGMLGADDIAGTVLFLLSDSSRYVNGQNIVVDDGFSL